ncbi:hypothetical protein GH5_03495 [Leishmania sp. Ghana 2012 LV757]|uniref:hypothetical protein n=1 Tax=Leishmania sp. Ghana 2012 LV757 TaxID=2803181 RepID=UPI001B59B747|nr:hypothetical protein GH5_03495 [Leishmania sp. Ghana 2012 LV757]
MGWFCVPVFEATVAYGTATEQEPVAAAEREPKHQRQEREMNSPTSSTEAEQLNLLVAGARLDDTEAQDMARFLGSNKRHTYADGLLSCVVYTFSGLQHIHGQSNALTLLTMWTVGTTFLVDVAERKYLQEFLQGTLRAAEATSEAEQQVLRNQPPHNTTATSTPGEATAAPAMSAASCTLPSGMKKPSPHDMEKLAEQQRKVFLTQAVASWVWMLASFQQFKVHKRLKWCGYSSWMGLGCAGYYTTRHLYSLLVQ